jgi:hypothetical protein
MTPQIYCAPLFFDKGFPPPWHIGACNVNKSVKDG